MKSWKHSESKSHGVRNSLSNRWLIPALSVLLLAGGALGTAHAQSTSGRIFGQAPAGHVVTAQSTTGLHRHVTVKDSGHYLITSLPAGTYDVVLEKNGAAVDTRKSIPLGASRGSEVDFACPQDKCDAP